MSLQVRAMMLQAAAPGSGLRVAPAPSGPRDSAGSSSPAVSPGVHRDHAHLADEEGEAWEGWGTCSKPPSWPGVVDVSP